ncbi:hypothetical protein ACFOWX_08800 [Sphingorhabdus arenilitoris]|uniref:UrcA family protein n=1 Tax=Sphingorhabdus arenilitoris TaxID=1490041 RepID=A0ABV8RJJ5_9SPHN
MTLSRFSSRLGALLCALFVSFTLLFVAPQAHAVKPGVNFYTIELTQNSVTTKQRIKGVFVTCTDGQCAAPLASTAHKNMCIAVVKELGAVKSFQAGGREFDAQDIASCNNKGGAGAPSAVAAAK